jgi:hypothetical protein
VLTLQAKSWMAELLPRNFMPADVADLTAFLSSLK